MKILIIQQKMIGDVLTSSILFEALRNKYPEAKLHYLIYSHTLPVVENNPFIDKIIEYDTGTGKNPTKFLEFLNFIRQESYTAVIDIYSKISSGIIAKYSGAPIRLGFHKNYTRPFYTQTFTYKEKPETKAGLAIENRMQVLEAFDEDFPRELKPKIYISSEEKESFRIKLREQGVKLEQPLIMCGVLGSSRKKSYPSAYMALLLDAIVRHLKEPQILLNYLPSQEKAALKIVSLCSPSTRSRIFPELYNSKLEDYIASCANCHAFIGNEGGAVHMAKAMEIPTFSIFSPQIEKENWSIYEDAKKNVSVHISDFKPEIKQLSNKEIRKKSAAFYELLQPNLIFAKLDIFLKEIVDSKKQETK